MQPSGQREALQLLRDAIQHHQRGDFSRAEDAYRAILAAQPDLADALHFLGMLCHQTGRDDEARRHMLKSVELDPDNARYCANFGSFLKTAGQLDQAEDFYRCALSLRPNYAEAHQNLADLMALRGNWTAAEAGYRELIRLLPQHAEGHRRLGLTLERAGRTAEAIAAHHRAVELEPASAHGWNEMGLAFVRSGDSESAIDCYRRAIALQPGFGPAHNNLGIALCELGRPTEAVAACRCAIELDGRDPQVYLNLANALRDADDLPAAAEAARQALTLRPEWDEARFNLALTLLIQGDFAEGWPDCEARWQQRVNRPEYPPALRWDGSNGAGQRILLHADHGFGDTLHFVRYASLLAHRGAQVSIRCQPELKRLLALLPEVDLVVGNDEPPPAFDVHCPLISLPRLFGTTVQSAPAQVPYITPNPKLRGRWRDRLAAEPPGLKVGLAWAGSTAFREDRFRSPHLRAFLPLGEVPATRFYSLQKGEAAREAADAPAGLSLTDWTADLHDFADTAALIDALDIVVSSDTAVVHLAGALAKPVWVLLHYAPGCFWMRGRPNSPWYPTMRLLRQSIPNDWTAPMQEAAQRLAELARRRASGT